MKQYRAEQYRAEPFDIINDVWLLQRRVLWLFWRTIGVGSSVEVRTHCDALNNKDITHGRDTRTNVG